MTTIRVITGYDGDCPWRDLLEANLTEYCDRWGYDLLAKFDGWKPLDVHLFWRKIELLRETISSCGHDWITWLDADCFVLNMTTQIESYIGGFDIGVTGPFSGTCVEEYDCRLKSGESHSAGILLIRNCQWSRDILDLWWENRDNKWRPDGCGDCMGDSAYLSCVMMNDPETRKHLHVFPLHEIGWATIANDPSQFIVHCYGSPNEYRRTAFEQYGKATIR